MARDFKHVARGKFRKYMRTAHADQVALRRLGKAFELMMMFVGETPRSLRNAGRYSESSTRYILAGNNSSWLSTISLARILGFGVKLTFYPLSGEGRSHSVDLGVPVHGVARPGEVKAGIAVRAEERLLNKTA